MRKFVLIAIALIIIALAAVFFYSTKAGPSGGEKIFCTADVKLCPDGSYSVRVPPTCDFEPCSSAASTSTSSAEGTDENTVAISAKLGETFRSNGLNFTPAGVVEDSRCPSDVVCIQAGTVKVKLRIGDEIETAEKTISLGGEAVSFGDISVALTGVKPAPNSKTTIKDSDYVFTFTISNSAN